ncbi:MAG: methionine adenosyltransferase [Promethearchaeota archaeon]
MVIKITMATSQKAIEQTDFPEMVERKGKGHPDSVCDEAAEACSRALCNYYMDKYGRYFHHNVDKAALVGGAAKPEFGGGIILEPQYFMIVGRATSELLVDNKLEKIPIGPICLSAMRETVNKTFRNLNLDTDMQLDYRVKPGSVDLTGVFDEHAKDGKEPIPLANDTSFGVGYAPFSDCEKITFEAEQLLNSDAFKDKCPGSGEDIKVMSHRVGNDVNITVCCAMVSKYIPDLSTYENFIEQMQDAVLDLAAKSIPEKNVTCEVNVGDKRDRSNPILFLTVTGTSAEAGDDGEVGRGNRGNGLITPCRTMSLEAVCGKNPVNHVGKLYNVLARKISEKIYADAGGDALEITTRLLSQIGHPVNEPWLADVSVIPAPNANLESLNRLANEVTVEVLNDVISVRDSIIAGKEILW